MAGRVRGIWISGRERPGTGGETLEVLNPYDGSVVGRIARGSSQDAADAVGVAVETLPIMRALPSFERAAILRRMADELRIGNDELVDIIVAEGGKPIRDARREVGRAIALFELAADHVMTARGEVLPMDTTPSGVNRFGYATRVPVGVIVAITPSNSPVNLSVNKLAPAFAAGNCVVQKPADQTPFSALWLAEAFARAGLPAGALNVVIGTVEAVAEPLVRDRRVRMVTITGSVGAGEAVARAAGVKKLALELGSSAANVVCADADIDAAASSLATSAFLSSGQACISAQRIIVHESVVDRFVSAFVASTDQLVIGDPRDPATVIGPMVSSAQVAKVLGWIGEAVEAGARVITGGVAHERTIKPTLVADVPADTELACNEVFAPVAVLSTFADLNEAVDLVNGSIYGLQAGLFTSDLTTAMTISERLDVGAVWVNDSSRYRQDNYPFGGMKVSGIGREGVQYAIDEMSEWKFVGYKLGPSIGIL